jgi:hypothetical protein
MLYIYRFVRGQYKPDIMDWISKVPLCSVYSAMITGSRKVVRYQVGLTAKLEANDGVSKRFRTGLLERELKMVQLSATRCSCIAIL